MESRQERPTTRQKKARVYDSKPNFFNSPYMEKTKELFFTSVAIAAAPAAGLTTVLCTTGAAAASACIPVCLGLMLGIIPAFMAAAAPLKKIKMKNETANLMFKFLLATSTVVLGLLLGIAAISLMATIALNPFTTSAMIAGGASAAFIIGAHLFMYRQMRKERLEQTGVLQETVDHGDSDFDQQSTTRFGYGVSSSNY